MVVVVVVVIVGDVVGQSPQVSLSRVARLHNVMRMIANSAQLDVHLFDPSL